MTYPHPMVKMLLALANADHNTVHITSEAVDQRQPNWINEHDQLRRQLVLSLKTPL